MKKISLLLAISIVLISSLLLTASATTTTPSMIVAQCMKVATAKKNAAFKAADNTYGAAIKKATGQTGKIARAKALSEYKTAQRVAQTTFETDRKACTAAAPKH